MDIEKHEVYTLRFKLGEPWNTWLYLYEYERICGVYYQA
jgi:hypothetical protein